jgi:hypothetical protein
MRIYFVAALFTVCLSGLAQEPFLKQSKQVPPHLEWNREIVAKQSGSIRFRVSSAERFGVTLITDQAFKDLRSGVKKRLGKDLLLTLDSRQPSLERTIILKPGSYHFILENQSDKKVEMKLECFEVK